MTRINTEDLRAIQGTEVDVEYLGRLIWFSISDMRVNSEQLEDAFAKAGLEKDFLPSPISPRDAFRRATKSAEAKGIPYEDKKLNLMVREVAMTNDTIVRQLVREVVDSKNVRLEYSPTVELFLDGETLRITQMADVRNPAEDEAIKKIEKNYETDKEYYNGRHVRDLVQKVLNTCDPVNVRPSGGVYFIPEKHAEKTAALTELAKILSNHSITYERTRVWSVPVIDVTEHREMVAESLEDQVRNNSESLINEMTRILQTERKITPKLAEGYVQKARDLKEMVKRYEEMLEGQQISTQAALDIAMQQALKLLGRVEVA